MKQFLVNTLSIRYEVVSLEWDLVMNAHVYTCISAEHSNVESSSNAHCMRSCCKLQKHKLVFHNNLK